MVSGAGTTSTLRLVPTPVQRDLCLIDETNHHSSRHRVQVERFGPGRTVPTDGVRVIGVDTVGVTRGPVT